MGQAGSSQQHQQGEQREGEASPAQGQTHARRPGPLHYSRSLRGHGKDSSSNSNNNGPLSPGSTPSRLLGRGDKRDPGAATSPTKPRRKSLDMPDMSLAMSTPGGGGGAQAGNAGPSSSSRPIQSSQNNQRSVTFSPSQASSSLTTPAQSLHVSPKTSVRVASTSTSGQQQPATDGNTADDGIAMAYSPLASAAGTQATDMSVTSPTASSAALSPAGRWARHKDGVKEGFGKKAQAVVGEAAPLHASGYSVNQATANNNAPSLSTSPTIPYASPPNASTSAKTSQAVGRPSVDMSNVRRFETGDTSILSATTNDDSAQSSGFAIRHDEHATAPSAPGQAVDPTQLASLLAARHHQQQRLQHQQEQQQQQPQQHQSNSLFPTSLQQLNSANISAASSSTAANQAPNNTFAPIPSPLKQPTETILAPELPSDVPILVPPVMPLEASLAIIDTGGMTLPSMSGAGMSANDAIYSSTSGAAGAGKRSTSASLIPGSTPPLGNPPNTLPAAAPLIALNPNLAQDPKAQEAVQAATVDLGAGPDGVPTLLTWKAEEETTGTSGLDGTGNLKAKIPSSVFVTGTFAKGWSTKIELRRKPDDSKHAKDFTALVKLPPGAHSLKFIVDKQWKTSKYLPSATDADGNLINYLQVHKVDSVPIQAADELHEDPEEDDDEQWTQEIPDVLLAYGDASEAAMDAQDAAREANERQHGPQGSTSLPVPALPQLDQSATQHNSVGASSIPSVLPNPAVLALQRKPLAQLQAIQPPSLPAQLEKGVLNATVLVAKGSGDDNSLLPKPDHSVLNHLAASPIKGGLLSVGVTTRYRRKYVTTVYYKKPM